MAFTSKSPSSEIELVCEEVLTVILHQSAGAFLEQMNTVSNELKQARCLPDTHLRFPAC